MVCLLLFILWGIMGYKLKGEREMSKKEVKDYLPKSPISIDEDMGSTLKKYLLILAFSFIVCVPILIAMYTINTGANEKFSNDVHKQTEINLFSYIPEETLTQIGSNKFKDQSGNIYNINLAKDFKNIDVTTDDGQSYNVDLHSADEDGYRQAVHELEKVVSDNKH